MGELEDAESMNRPTRQPRRLRHATAMAMVAVLVTAGSAHADYTVMSGDTLEGIARRHGTTVTALMGANGIADPHRIAIGTTLSLPGAAAGSHHVVRPGETLSGIAGRVGVPAAQLAEWNGLPDVHTVKAGQRISVSGPAAHHVATTGGGTHRVAPGETLSHIALRMGVGVAELARANGIADADRIVAGTTLSLPGGWHCPVRGPVRFVNDFGITKPGGRFHDGVDLFAARGTPVVAPVGGRVEHAQGARAGLQFRLHGADGHVYIGTHLDSLGASGSVQAGTVLGTVGTSGNAHGTSPHLHFEVYADGTRLANPYPSLRAACG